MVFSFNFNVGNESGECGESVTENKMDNIQWKQASEILISESHYKRVSELQSSEKFELVNENNDDKETGEDTEHINFINSATVSINLKMNGYKGDLEEALENNTDLVAGVYEGGLKIWECSEDLVKLLYNQYYHKLGGCKVLEVGCGAGLPGVLAFTAGATVHFNDYNQEVLDEVTIPNILLNIKSHTEKRKHNEVTDSSETPSEEKRIHLESMGSTSATENLDEDTTEEPPSGEKLNQKEVESVTVDRTRFFCGDWAHLDLLLSKINDGEKYDFILTAETIYNPDNHQKLISLIRNHLKPGKAGVALIAAKSYYFGVGGGVRDFQTKLESSGFDVESVKKYETGVKREILAASLP